MRASFEVALSALMKPIELTEFLQLADVNEISEPLIFSLNLELFEQHFL